MTIMRQLSRRLTLLAPALVALSAAPALAQRASEPALLGPPRFFGGLTLLGAQPQGEFAEFIDAGFGIGAHGIMRLDERGLFGIRLDGGFVNYGSETKRVPLSSTVGGRIMVDVNTTNNIFFLGAGPQLLLPTGSVRPYVNGNVGFSVFSTSSSVEGANNTEPFATDENFSDITFAYGGGAGLYIPVYRGKSTVSLDIGARYHSNGRVEYLREGSIVDLPNGDIEINPIRSRANLITYHLGVSIGGR
jgi:hypothetical protein